MAFYGNKYIILKLWLMLFISQGWVHAKIAVGTV